MQMAAGQWGQPAAPFGMAGTGMWPTYPGMAAPSYGVGPGWAAAAQLNARCLLTRLHLCWPSPGYNTATQDITAVLIGHSACGKLPVAAIRCAKSFCNILLTLNVGGCRFGNNGFGGGGVNSSGDMAGGANGAVKSPTMGPNEAAVGKLSGAPGKLSGMMPTGVPLFM